MNYSAWQKTDNDYSFARIATIDKKDEMFTIIGQGWIDHADNSTIMNAAAVLLCYIPDLTVQRTKNPLAGPM